VPEDPTARHRARGLGRLLTLRNASPRHAAPATIPPAPAADPDTGTLRPPRVVIVLAVLAVLMLTAAATLTFRGPGAPQVAGPVPTLSIPRVPGEAGPPAPASRRQLQAVRQAAKASSAPSTPATSAPTTAPRVMLGPATDADLPPLLSSYCRTTYGRFTMATSTPDGWVCALFGRPPIAVDMDAMCRWRYGDNAWAALGTSTNPQSWRCYRDGP
jgi:hypothetical protein